MRPVSAAFAYVVSLGINILQPPRFRGVWPLGVQVPLLVTWLPSALQSLSVVEKDLEVAGSNLVSTGAPTWGAERRDGQAGVWSA